MDLRQSAAAPHVHAHDLAHAHTCTYIRAYNYVRMYIVVQLQYIYIYSTGALIRHVSNKLRVIIELAIRIGCTHTKHINTCDCNKARDLFNVQYSLQGRRCEMCVRGRAGDSGYIGNKLSSFSSSSDSLAPNVGSFC